MTKYGIKTNKPLSDLDDEEMLHLLIVPARMKGAVYTAKSRDSDGFGKITPYHVVDLLHGAIWPAGPSNAASPFFNSSKRMNFGIATRKSRGTTGS